MMSCRLGKSSVSGLLMGFIIALCFTNFRDFHSDNFSLKAGKMNKNSLNRTKEKTLTVSEMSEIYDVTDCSYKISRKRFEQRGNFWVLLNYIQAERRFQCFESVTYTTQGEYSFIDSLLILVNRWRGPISVTFYTPGYDFQNTIRSIAYLRNCGSALIKKYVTFHLFFPYDHTPSLEVRSYNSSIIKKLGTSLSVKY